MRKIVLLICLSLTAVFSKAQNVHITGTVTGSQDAMPVIAASVVIKNTTQGTLTDINGKYSIDVPKGSLIVFSFIGLRQQEFVVSESQTLDVKLENEVLNLNEVVVTAIGISRDKKALGYGVQELKSEEINKSGNTNIINSIAGKVPGVQITNSTGAVGGSTFIEIRGGSSITGSNRPLFVIDGVPIDGGGGEDGTSGVATSDRIIDLNPDDIETVNILKGGASTALYGLRASNGAIIISTKKGKIQKNGKSKIEFHSSLSFESVTQLPPLQTKYAQGSYTDAYQYGNNTHPGYSFNPLASPDGYSWNWVSWGPSVDSLAYYTKPGYMPYDAYGFQGEQHYESMDSYRKRWDPNGRIVNIHQPDIQDSLGYYANGPVRTYNPYDIFKTGHTYNNFISISGGNESSTYYLSIANNTSDGVIPNNKLAKNSFKLSVTKQLSPKWKSSADVNYITSETRRSQQGSNLSGLMLGLLRTPPTFNNAMGYEFPDGQQRSYRGGTGYDNPYWSVNNTKYIDNMNRIIGNITFNYNPLKWAEITYRLGTDWYMQRGMSFYEINSSEFPEGHDAKSMLYSSDINSDLLINIKQNIGQYFAFNATLGNNLMQSFAEGLGGSANGLIVKNWDNLANSPDTRASESTYKKRTAAFYGDLGVSYKSLLYLNVTGRNEWSTTMPLNNRSFFYPSVSSSFIFTELPAFNGSNILDMGKLRASYAITALDAAAYSTSNYYGVAGAADGWTNGISFPFMGYPGFTYGNVIGNKGLKPEKTKNFEFGTELHFFNNRFSVDADYFLNKSEDLLFLVPVSSSNGFKYKYMNAATKESKGFEVMTTLIPIRTKTVEWELTVNFSNPHSKVTSLAQDIENVSLNTGFVDPQFHAVVGQPYRTIWGTRWLRDKSGSLIIEDDPKSSYYGMPVVDTKSGIIGNVEPKWTMGITNSLRIDHIKLSFLVDIKTGGQMWNGTKGAMYYFGTHKDTEGRTTATTTYTGILGHIDSKSGTVAHYDGSSNSETDGPGSKVEVTMPLNESWYYKGLGNGFNGPAEQFIEKTDWIRLREVSISYDFPSKFLAKSTIQQLEIYFTGHNLWIKTPYTGVDPETSLFGASNAQGADYFNMPGTKSYTFGVRVSF